MRLPVKISELVLLVMAFAIMALVVISESSSQIITLANNDGEEIRIDYSISGAICKVRLLNIGSRKVYIKGFEYLLANGSRVSAGFLILRSEVDIDYGNEYLIDCNTGNLKLTRRGLVFADEFELLNTSLWRADLVEANRSMS